MWIARFDRNSGGGATGAENSVKGILPATSTAGKQASKSTLPAPLPLPLPVPLPTKQLPASSPICLRFFLRCWFECRCEKRFAFEILMIMFLEWIRISSIKSKFQILFMCISIYKHLKGLSRDMFCWYVVRKQFLLDPGKSLSQLFSWTFLNLNSMR